jgi:alpha-tubulin suppressor-like RCC1 family protein
MHTRNVVKKMLAAMSVGAVLAVGCGPAAGDEERTMATARQGQSAQATATVATGRQHAVAVRSNGTVWTWGANGYGALGDGTTTTRNAPVQVPGITNAVKVAAGEYNSFAILSDGTVRAWGFNYYNQLGDGTGITRTTPVQVQGLTNVAAVASGLFHTLALRTDGTVWAWGANFNGQLGDGTHTARAIPVQIPGLANVMAVAADGEHNLAVRADGTVWAWGHNHQGQLGNTTIPISPGSHSTTPVQAQGLTTAVDVGAGLGHSMAVLADGTARAWGDNYFGQLGDGTNADRSTPVQIQGLTGVMLVDGGTEGYLYSIAVRADGSLMTWGHNRFGQLAQGTSNCPGYGQLLVVNVPALSTAPSGITFASAGDQFNVVQRSDGTVWTWGFNNSGQLGIGSSGGCTHVPQQVQGLP